MSESEEVCIVCIWRVLPIEVLTRGCARAQGLYETEGEPAQTPDSDIIKYSTMSLYTKGHKKHTSFKVSSLKFYLNYS